MTKLILSAALIDQFRAAKASSDPKSAKKAVWAAIRSAYGIPSYVKLGGEFDVGHAALGTLWVKDSNPRQFLQVNDLGRYINAVADGATAVPAKVSAPTAIASAARFAASDSSANDKTWHVVTRQELLDLLREGTPSGDDAGSLPDGFPTNLGADAVVLDSTSGNLYFRA